MYIRRNFLTGLLAVSMIGAQAQQELPLDPALRTGRLANGLTYFIRHNEQPEHRVLIYLVCKAGSVLESEDQRGLAHFMEHMSFNGTTHFPKNELVDYLQKAGVRFGADINAHTSFDETVYELPLPSDRPDVLKNGLQIVHDWAQSATLDPMEIDKERGVVLEEKRLGKGAGERMQRIYYPLITNNSRYSVRMPIGIDTVLNNFKPETIRRFYKDWYRPDLQAVIIVGDIDAAEMEKKIRTDFADLKNPARERVRTKYTIPLTGRNQFIAVTDREMTSVNAEVSIKHEGYVVRTTTDYRRSLVENLLDDMLAARYAEVGRQADPPFVEGKAGVGGFLGGLDAFDVELIARPGQLARGFSAAWREVVRARRFGFTQSELDRAKKAGMSYLSTILKEKDKTPSVSLVKEYQKYFLKGDASPGIDYEYDLAQHLMPGITLAEVNSLLNEYLTPTNRDILLMAPDKDKASLPDSATVESWLAAVESEQLQPYKDEVSSLPLLKELPVTGKVSDSSFDKDLGITTLTLANGVKVLLKPTDFRNDEIRFNAFSAGGTSLYSDADYESAENAVGVVTAGGLGNYGPVELRKYMTGRQAKVEPYISERTQGIKGVARPEDLETALQLVYGYFTQPRKDTAAFTSIVEKTRAMLPLRMNDPAAEFNDTVSAVLGNHCPRRTGPSLEKLSQLSLNRAFDIYRQRFSDASGFTFVFVGSFNVAAITPLLEKYLGALPATHKSEQARDLGIHIPAGVMDHTFYRGTEQRATVYLVFSGPFDYSRENLIRLDALKECLEIRMLERLREDESGVYAPGVSARATKYPDGRYSFMVHFGCAPQNADKLVASALDEIRRLRTDGPLPVNLDKWRAEDKALRETTVRTNNWWLDYIGGQLADKADLHELDRYRAQANAVTRDAVKAMARQCLSGDNYIRFEWLPARGATNSPAGAKPDSHPAGN